MGTTQKELLIKKKQELVAIEQELETVKLQSIRADKNKPYGICIFLFFLGAVIFLGGAAGAGVPVIFLPGFIIAIAGIIMGISRAVHNYNAGQERGLLRKEIETHNNKIVEIKNRIIEMENS